MADKRERRKKEIRQEMETLAISIAHTTIQHDRARESCDEAEIHQDKQGVAKHQKRMEDCEKDLKEFKEKNTFSVTGLSCFRPAAVPAAVTIELRSTWTGS